MTAIAISRLLYASLSMTKSNNGQFSYAADSWTRQRRIIVKAEYLKKGENVRFVVTNINYASPAEIYYFYCQRRDMENRIEELPKTI